MIAIVVEIDIGVEQEKEVFHPESKTEDIIAQS